MVKIKPDAIFGSISGAYMLLQHLMQRRNIVKGLAETNRMGQAIDQYPDAVAAPIEYQHTRLLTWLAGF
jgi:hypothetical protein